MSSLARAVSRSQPGNGESHTVNLVVTDVNVCHVVISYIARIDPRPTLQLPIVQRLSLSPPVLISVVRALSSANCRFRLQ
jgi:hypothetical protein